MNQDVLKYAIESGLVSRSEVSMHPNFYRFAELIVRQCANVVDGKVDGDTSSYPHRTFGDKIKAHFGVD